jgi:hypothetical protein
LLLLLSSANINLKPPKRLLPLALLPLLMMTPSHQLPKKERWIEKTRRKGLRSPRSTLKGPKSLLLPALKPLLMKLLKMTNFLKNRYFPSPFYTYYYPIFLPLGSGKFGCPLKNLTMERP